MVMITIILITLVHTEWVYKSRLGMVHGVTDVFCAILSLIQLTEKYRFTDKPDHFTTKYYLKINSTLPDKLCYPGTIVL